MPLFICCSIGDAEKSTFFPMFSFQNPSIDDLGKLVVFAGVKEFPARVKCASLAWHTMHSALNKEEKIISTE